jgi:hypothetical protein
MKPRKFKVGDMVAESHMPSDVGFITKIEKSHVLFHCIHGKRAGKVYSTHKHWLVRVDDIVFEEAE